MRIPMLKIRRSRDRLIFNMLIPILVRRHLYIETAPCIHLRGRLGSIATESTVKFQSNTWIKRTLQQLQDFGETFHWIMKQSPEDKEVSRYFIDTPSWITCNHLIRFRTEASGGAIKRKFFTMYLYDCQLLIGFHLWKQFSNSFKCN